MKRSVTSSNLVCSTNYGSFRVNISIGTLVIKPTAQHTELLAAKVAEMLVTSFGTAKIGIAEIDPNLSDTAAFCENYQIPLNQAANCVVLEAKHADKTWFAACVIPGNTRADINGLVRRTLDARKVSFAPMEKAVAQTEMEYGAITPIGLPSNWPLLIDKAVVDSEYVIIGSGIRKSKLVVPGNILASIPNVQVLNALAKNTQISGT